MRDRRVARVIDREIAPIWHDRFARLIIRNLPNSSDVIALDIHCGVGRTTAELLHRLGATARVLALEPDDTLIELARTRMRPEWKNRVYLKVGDFDDITAMADDSYNLVVANLVLGDAGDLGGALTEMIRVNRIGGRILATVPIAGSWNEVEDIFSEVLRDAGLHDAVRRLDRLRDLRPTGAKLADTVRQLGVAEDDFVIEQERFQMLFPSGREFLFAPVVEHGPLRLWKAVIGKDGSPQELFWRLKEAIDTYYTGHVLAVNVLAGLINITVAKGTETPGPRLAARFWRHYPGLDSLWGGLAAGYVKVSEPSLPPFGDAEFDFDLEIDEGEARRTGAQKAVTTALPIAMDDLADESGSPSDVPFKPAQTAARREPMSRSAARSAAQPVVAAKPAVAAKPVLAEDDFSDINEPLPPRQTARSEPRSAFIPQPKAAPAPPTAPAPRNQPEEPEEPAEPTAPFRPEELREATTRRTDDAASSVRQLFDDDDDDDASSKTQAEPAGDAQQDAAPDEHAESDEHVDDAHHFADDDSETDESTSAAAASDPDSQPDLDDPPVAEPVSATDSPAEPAKPSRSLGRPSLSPLRPTPDSGAFRRPNPGEGLPFRPPPDSGSFPRPTPTSPSTASVPPRADSGVFRPPTAGAPHGVFQPPEPGTQRLEDSGVRRPAASQVDSMKTGSFKVFAPPRPRLSPETDLSDTPAPELDAQPIPEPSAARPITAQPITEQPEQPDTEQPDTEQSSSAQLVAELLAEQSAAASASGPRRSLSDRLGSLLLDLDPRPNSGDSDDDVDEDIEADEDIEPMDELEEEQPKVSAKAPPPRPPPPPTGLLFKPRPLLPIVPPPKPKK